ncbi:reverse transcriptase domain-containing protein [Tanacetum coccineum]
MDARNCRSITYNMTIKSFNGQIYSKSLIVEAEYAGQKDELLAAPIEVEEKLSDPWALFTDGSSYVDGFGIVNIRIRTSSASSRLIKTNRKKDRADKAFKAVVSKWGDKKLQAAVALEAVSQSEWADTYTLEGTEFTYSLIFEFNATNNEVEYEALITGLRITEQMGIKNL